jgi:Lon protease-like protein
VSDFAVPRIVRLFPLHGLYVFPHSLIPLHIFEPRYRQMTRDALADDRTIAMALPSRAGAAEPVPLHPICCIGSIHEENKLPDGRFTFLLRGEARVRIENEVSSGKLYRTAQVVELPDQTSPNLLTCRRLQRSHIMSKIEPLLRRSNDIGERFIHFLTGECTPGMFTDLIAHWAPFPPEIKHALLFEPDVDRRLQIVAEAVERLSSDQEGPAPTGFSAN